MDSKLEKLLEFDTPSITNVVATYPSKLSCLGLYHPWKGKWYTNQEVKAMYPEHGRKVGYAVTCVYGLPDPGYNRLSFGDLLRAIDASPKPVILAVKQDFPEDIKRINGLLGGNMMTAFKSAGVVGVVSDGPSRDVDEVRPLGMQYMLTGVTAGHGNFALQAINVPVEICDMAVAPGEIIHMDENGAVKFPADKVEEILKNVVTEAKVEARRQALMRATTDVEELIKIMKGVYD